MSPTSNSVSKVYIDWLKVFMFFSLGIAISLSSAYTHAQDSICNKSNNLIVYWACEGSPSHQYQLGYIYEAGTYGLVQDNTEALKWYRRSAEVGFSEAEYKLGEIYKEGKLVPQSYAEALKWYELAAKQKMLPALEALAILYLKGEGVPQSDTKALKWYQLMAEQGDVKAQFTVGTMFEKGIGTTLNYATAQKWYEMAAMQGLAEAQYNLGVIYAKGLGRERNDSEALKWKKLAAKQGFVAAQYDLSVMYANGNGTDKDNEAALRWSQLAVESSVKGAEIEKGDSAKIDDSKQNRTQDDVQVFKSFENAAKQGDTKAQYYLGYFYDNGLGVPASRKEAFKWYQLAANGGNAEAQARLGGIYSSGLGEPEQNYATALKWFKLAAKQGNTDAMIGLATLYTLGVEVNLNQVIAYAYLSLALNRGHHHDNIAIKRHDTIGKDLTLAQKNKVDALVRNWVKGELFTVEDTYTDVGSELSRNSWDREGNVNSYYNIGELYYHSRHINKCSPNYPKALEFFQQAAMQGHPNAQYALGMMYFDGVGVTQNRTLAYVYFIAAAEQQPYDIIINARDKAAQTLTQTQRAAAQKSVNNWVRGTLLVDPNEK